MAIRDTVEECITKCIEKAESSHPGRKIVVKAIGITNQRETTVIWHRRSGLPLHNAIVWLDNRTAAVCKRLEAQLGSKVSLCCACTCIATSDA